MTKALFPVTFEELQRFLNVIGYGMAAHEDTGIVFTLVESKRAEKPHFPVQITIMKPDFEHPTTGEHAYEKDYVLDLITTTLRLVEPDGDIITAIRKAIPPKEKS